MNQLSAAIKLSLIVGLLVAALLAAVGCSGRTYEHETIIRANGERIERVRYHNDAFDTKFGEASFEKRPDGTMVGSMKSYDAQNAGIMLGGKALDVAGAALKGKP